MSTLSPTVEGILDLAHRLPRKEQAELIAQLARLLAVSPAETPRSTSSAEDAWNSLRSDLSSRPVGSTSMAEQLEADRRERDQILRD